MPWFGVSESAIRPADPGNQHQRRELLMRQVNRLTSKIEFALMPVKNARPLVTDEAGAGRPDAMKQPAVTA